jgi:hypothetical protein
MKPARMEKATIAGGFFKLLALWEHASSGHTKTYESSIAKRCLPIPPSPPSQDPTPSPEEVTAVPSATAAETTTDTAATRCPKVIFGLF